MGFSSLIDIVGSIIIGGFLLILLWRIDDAAIQSTYNNTQELILQENLATSAMILENDFRRIGYCKNYSLIATTDAIISATDTSISFKTDVNDAGVVNTLNYYVGPSSELASTPNPRDRFLYRVVDSETPVGVNLGITQFKLVYFLFFSWFFFEHLHNCAVLVHFGRYEVPPLRKGKIVAQNGSSYSFLNRRWRTSQK